MRLTVTVARWARLRGVRAGAPVVAAGRVLRLGLGAPVGVGLGLGGVGTVDGVGDAETVSAGSHRGGSPPPPQAVESGRIAPARASVMTARVRRGARRVTVIPSVGVSGSRHRPALTVVLVVDVTQSDPRTREASAFGISCRMRERGVVTGNAGLRGATVDGRDPSRVRDPDGGVRMVR
ncbi:hypothetical protein EF879_08195 [Micromonospora sp. HM5-17]|nr:hypothetical protein EF879_08195 [Micromonospora sp. HM5-17]